MRSPIIGWTSTAPSTSAANFQVPQCAGGASWNATETTRRQIVPHDMTIDNLRVTVTVAPGAAASGKKYDIVLMVNGSPSALTCTILETATSAQDLTNHVRVSAGDAISLRFTPTGTPTAPGTSRWSMIQEAQGVYGVMQSTTSPPSTASTNYLVPYGRAIFGSTDALAGIIIPTAGVLRNLRFYASTAPGAGKSWAITVMKNNSAQALTCTIADTNTTASDLSNSVTVAAGDTISIKVVTTSTPGANPIAIAMSFDPDIDGESFVTYSDVAGVKPSTSATNFQSSNESGDAWNATETNVQGRWPALTVKAIYARTSVSPGVSPKAYAFTMRQNAANSAAAVTVNDASSTPGGTSARQNQTTGLSVAVADDDLIANQSVPTSTPLGLFPKISLLTYIQPRSMTFQNKLIRNTLIRM